MITSIRKKFNAAYTDAAYQQFLQSIHNTFNHVPAFRIAETPVFFDRAFKAQLFKACEEITEQISQPDFTKKSGGAIDPKFKVGNEDNHTLFLQLDFGICEDTDGGMIPQLIEIQGFPSLYFYQDLLAQKYREYFKIPEDYSHLFMGLTSPTYIELLRKNIIGDSHPENVILMECRPDKQATRIDFLCTQKHLGLAIKCISEIKKEGRELYYLDDKGKKIGIERIYNRVIFDELHHYPDLKREFYLKDDVNVTWAGHPNWFFRISKHTLPFLKSQFLPETHIISDLASIPEDLHNYVLKPLYSFAGSGVIINLKRSDLEGIDDPENYILQKKVKYAPVIETPTGPAKCEVRMLMLWEPDASTPKVITNLVRMSKGEMMGVKYNKDKDWIGATIGFFEPG